MTIIFEVLLKMLGALILSLPLALEREASQRAAGFRTFVLVAVTSCGFLLTGYRFLDDQIANARLMQGLIGGLGFLGGGAILQSKGSVKGMATAAGIWSAGAIGMAVAFGAWEIGIVLSLLNLLTLRFGKGSSKDDDHDDRPEMD